MTIHDLLSLSRTGVLFYKLTSVFLCVCPLIDDKLRHNIVKVAVQPRAAGEWFRSKL